MSQKIHTIRKHGPVTLLTALFIILISFPTFAMPLQESSFELQNIGKLINQY